MALKHGNIDISSTSNCPEHCQNCKNLKAVIDDHGFSDGIGYTACDDLLFICDETDSPCPENKVDCPSVTLPPFCKNCAGCTDCVFTENEEPQVNVTQYNVCLVDGMGDYLLENLAV